MYKVVIGLEVHCELKSNSKNFSSAKNSYSEMPNTNIATVDLGYPGVLPVVNKEAVKKSIKMALAMNCKIPEYLLFDRKNYFYPDLPKGYQITQLHHPIGENGYVMIHANGIDKKILIHDTHLEEDTASLDHYLDYSLIDYNRAGVPLLETVTEPCIESADEAIAFLEALRSIFLYCDASDARSDRGEMRCDVNISLMDENATELGTRTEMKNINSFYNVREAIECEIKRQTEILESGGVILQETRRFDDKNLCTYKMRSKEDAIDYKYFIDANIPPVKIEESFIDSIKSEIPLLQFERIEKYMNEYDLSRYDATVLVKDKAVAEYFEEAVSFNTSPKSVSNWITSSILGYLNKLDDNINNIYIRPNHLVELIKMLDDGKISSKQAKEVLNKCLIDEKTPTEVVDELGIKQMDNSDELKKIVEQVFSENSSAKEMYKAGKTNIIDFLVGQVMKKTRGQANPSTTMDLIKEEIERS